MLVKPEEVGLSSPRLARIGEHFQQYIAAGKLAGTLTLIARQGKVAYVEPQGHLEIERRRPVTQDAVFRIYSMTKWWQERHTSTAFKPGAVTVGPSTHYPPDIPSRVPL